MIKQYFYGLYRALIGKPVLVLKEVQVTKQVVRDLSMTTSDIEEAKKAFPLERWKKGCSIEDFARSDGEQRVLEWFVRRVGVRTTVGPVRNR